MNFSGFNLPHIGNRIIKSAVGVLLCYVVYMLRGGEGIPLYSMLAVLWCIQPYSEKTFTMAYQRALGTLIGAAFGLLTVLFELYVLPIHDTPPGYLLISAMIIPVIYTTVLINKKNASYFSCVVFLSITVTNMADRNPFEFALNRTLDTFIGIALAVAINYCGMPRRRVRDKLFVACLDDMISPVKDELPAFTKIEINRMLDDGLKFTVSTMRTPAGLIKTLSEVRLTMPVVVMNGAALYDISQNSYVKAYIISNPTCFKLKDMIEQAGVNCFVNALCDDNLMIYYDRLENSAEKSIFAELKKSPYRNYIRRSPQPGDRVIYLMMIDRRERIEELYRKISESEQGGLLKLVSYPSDSFEGFYYLKIYNKNACARNMIQYLTEEYGIEAVQTIGAGEEYDIKAEGGINAIAKALKASFKPIIFRS